MSARWINSCPRYTRQWQTYALYAQWRKNGLAAVSQYRQPLSGKETIGEDNRANTNRSFTEMSKPTKNPHQ